ncbi:uncharacterized protein METZ01_LOCUS336514, partial [marine metagenome]
MNSRRGYGKLDDQPIVDGDKSFRGLKSYPDPTTVEEGFLASATSVRQDKKAVEIRKGMERKYWDKTNNAGVPTFAATRYANPNAASVEDTVAMALGDEAILYDPETDAAIVVPYQSGQSALIGAATLVESFGSLFLYRGGGA